MLDVCGPAEFVRSDANGDAAVDIADAISILSALFSGGTLPCPDAADANDDGLLDIADAITVLTGLFGGAPGGGHGCEADATPDSLGCPTPPSAC